MSNRLQIFYDALHDFTNRTTYHGLLHLFLAHSKARRVFWLILFVAALSAGLFHMVKSVQKFQANSVTSIIKPRSEMAVFPAITNCNLRPASFVSYDDRFFAYLHRYWDEFNNWFIEEKPQRVGESRSAYRERSRQLYRRLMHVLWVSADTRDISHLDKTMLLRCSFNGVTCGHQNLSLIQTNQFWNFYTLHTDREHLSSGTGNMGAQLEMMLFTDGYDMNNANNPMNMQNTKPDNPSGENVTQNVNEITLRDLLFSRGAINRVLASDNNYESQGVRIFIHEDQKYPLQSTEFVDVAGASSVSIQLKPMRNHLLPTQSQRCSEPPLETVRYVTYFKHASQNIATKAFTKSVADYVVEAKQKLIHEHCGCYSHRFPFHVNTSQLCYYAPPEYWLKPSESVLANIRCHDEWLDKAEEQSGELKKQFQNRRWCHYWRFRAWQQGRKSWPPYEVLGDIWLDSLAPQIENGVEFLPGDGRSHHIMNASGGIANNKISRETMIFMGKLSAPDEHCNILIGCYILEDCQEGMTKPTLADLGSCINPKLLAENLAEIRIALQSPAADAYAEVEKFHWTETFSHIGGTMGLWLGISVLSALKLLDLLYDLVCRCLRGPPIAEPPSEVSAMENAN